MSYDFPIVTVEDLRLLIKLLATQFLAPDINNQLPGTYTRRFVENISDSARRAALGECADSYVHVSHSYGLALNDSCDQCVQQPAMATCRLALSAAYASLSLHAIVRVLYWLLRCQDSVAESFMRDYNIPHDEDVAALGGVEGAVCNEPPRRSLCSLLMFARLLHQ